MKIFITGGTGFIGQAVIKQLISHKYEITALVRDKNSAELLSKLGKIETVIGDITKPETYKEKLYKSKTLIHLAALRSNWMPKDDFNKINVEVIRNFFTNNSKLKHIIITSSVFVHGIQKKLPINEKSPLLAYDLYGKSKIELEKLTRSLSQKFNIPFTIIRPAVVYGPGDNKSGMIIKLIDMLRSGKFPLIGGGKNTWHLVYVDDLAQGYLKAVEKGGENQTYILAGNKPIRLTKLIDIINHKFKIDTKIISLPYFPFFFLGWIFEISWNLCRFTGLDIFKKEPLLMRIKVDNLSKNRFFDISKAKKYLGYSPSTDYTSGVKNIYAWFMKFLK